MKSTKIPAGLAILASILLVLMPFAMAVAPRAEIASEMAPAIEPPATVFAWNYTPDPAVTRVRRAVQAYIDFRDPIDGAPRWAARRVRFYVDGASASPEQAVARLLELPVLTWAHPYHLAGIAGAPAEFSPESIDAHQALVASARIALRSSGLSEYRCDRISHVVDFESFADYSKPPLVTGAAFAVQADHATTACHLFGQALRDSSWDQRDGAGAANYGTNHSGSPLVAGGGNQRATPAYVPGSMDQRTRFLSGYTSGGPFGCLGEAELLDAIGKAAGGSVWIAVDDYQPGRDSIISAALGRCKLIALWGTEPGTAGAEAGNRSMAEWSSKQDAAIAAATGMLPVKGK